MTEVPNPRAGEGAATTRAELLIPSEIPDSNGLNRVIGKLRKGMFADLIGYVPPLILDSPPNKYILTAIQQGILKPEEIPAALFNSELANYVGVAGNFRLTQTEPDPNNMRVRNKRIDLDRAIAFRVSADLLSKGGIAKGQMEQEFTLYAVSPETVTHIGLKLWRRFYGREALRTQHLLFMSCVSIDRSRTKKDIRREGRRHERAVRRGQNVESTAVFLARPSGLPTLGKKR